MPVYLRTFYILKMSKMFKDQKKEHDKQLKKAHSRSKSTPRSKVPKMRGRWYLLKRGYQLCIKTN